MEALSAALTAGSLYRFWMRRCWPVSLAVQAKSPILETILTACLRHVELHSLPIHTLLFRVGERCNEVYYLLDGRVLLRDRAGHPQVVVSHNPATAEATSTRPARIRHPLGGDVVNRSVTATLLSRSLLLSIDITTVGFRNTLKGVAGRSLPSAGRKQGSWMRRLLNQGWAEHLDTTASNSLLQDGERHIVHAGEILQMNNVPVRHVYILESGSCLTYKGAPLSMLSILAILTAGLKNMPMDRALSLYMPGACIGDMLAIQGLYGGSTISEVTAQMLTEGVVHAIPQQVFVNRYGERILGWLVDHAKDRQDGHRILRSSGNRV